MSFIGPNKCSLVDWVSRTPFDCPFKNPFPHFVIIGHIACPLASPSLGSSSIISEGYSSVVRDLPKNLRPFRLASGMTVVALGIERAVYQSFRLRPG